MEGRERWECVRERAVEGVHMGLRCCCGQAVYSDSLMVLAQMAVEAEVEVEMMF